MIFVEILNALWELFYALFTDKIAMSFQRKQLDVEVSPPASVIIINSQGYDIVWFPKLIVVSAMDQTWHFLYIY